MTKPNSIDAFYSLPIAVGLFCFVLITILFYMMWREKRKEHHYRQRYPQATKPINKIIPFNTVKN